MTDYKQNQIKNYYKTKAKNTYYKNVYNKLIKKDVIYKITHNLSRRLCTELKKRNIILDVTYNSLLGCTIDTFKLHLQNLFLSNMTFENYGEWEVDHIIAVSLFDLNDIEDLNRCCNYKNLQPIWKHDNRVKYNKIEDSKK